MRNNWRARWRPFLAAVVGAATLISLTGCALVFPSRPNSAPVFLTERDGEVVFRWCGETTPEFESLKITYRVVINGEKEHFTAAQGEGLFRFGTEQEFTTREPPIGLEYHTSGSIPLDSYPLVVFLDADQVAPGTANDLATFNLDAPDQLANGQWVAPGGPVADVPC
ncbi:MULTISPECIES: hypothetical protein [Microbacterium]|uniref:Uncharacterized protein n=1 Tax=Microbacterium wangchenii TaxID=2541726 RepID=A0ABX5SRN2_9MICO|nr:MULTISPECIES: hypothetical protein [Microbacterium]MCK6065356.1 hypothetical protein [Microbacterium sp. EYE_512]QBR88800.1 hypothetical protein E4K62_08885 [Microbacterium wangchenii]TFV82146.1 hypothetical protein E4V99_14625 [Microbacterium sp. dk485]